MKRAIIYLRVSTDEQAKSGLGLDAQLNSAMKKAKELGATQILTFTDAGVSGSTPIEKRPGLSQALAGIRKGDVLIVAKRDRLSRSLPIAIAIEELLKNRKATLISANGEGTGESTDNVSSVMESRMSQIFSEIERQMIRDRTRAALAVKKSRGERVGTVPYGYQLSKDGIHLELNPPEQKVIRAIQSLREQGLTFHKIVAKLNHDCIPTRKGTPWQYRTVWNISHPVLFPQAT
jgi:site-specific DNA recombinase